MTVRIFTRTGQPFTIDVPGQYIEREKVDVDTPDGGTATAVLDWLIYDLPPDDEDRRVVAIAAAEAVLSISVVEDVPVPDRPLAWVNPSAPVSTTGSSPSPPLTGAVYHEAKMPPIIPLTTTGEMPAEDADRLT